MYSFYDLALFLLIYSFLGWAAEAGYYAVTRRRFCNRGVVALPLVLAYGFTFVLLMLLLPTLAGQHLLSFLATMVVSAGLAPKSSGTRSAAACCPARERGCCPPPWWRRSTTWPT